MEQQIISVAGPVLEALAGKFGIVVQVLSWMATCRIIFKPINTALAAIADSNAVPAETKAYSAFKASPVYKWMSFLFDFTASIKLPQNPQA